MGDKITLTQEEKERLKNAYPYIKDGNWDEAFRTIANEYGDYKRNWVDYPIHILHFLKENGIDLWRKITKIPQGAFYGCKGLYHVDIPSNVTEIGSFAFYGCTNLKEIKIPSSVKVVGDNAFNLCEKMMYAEIQDGIQVMEDCLFAVCRKLERVTIPQSVVKIGENVFAVCASLREVYYNGTKEQWDAIEKPGFIRDYMTESKFEVIFLK